MDTSTSSRPTPGRTNSNGKTPRQGEKTEEKASGISLKSSQSTHRGTRYKEKFQALREQYEQVSNTHDQFEKDLLAANEKVRKLQEECNLLLDAVDIAVPAQPSLLHYLSQDPIPPQYHSYQVPFPAVPSTPAPQPPPPPPQQPSQPARSRRRSGQQTNGNGVKRKVKVFVGPSRGKF